MAGDNAGLRQCFQPTWEKGLPEGSPSFPVKGTRGWISGEGAEWSVACMVCSCLRAQQKKPSESVPFSLIALKSGLQQGILPPKIRVMYFPSVLPSLLLGFCQLCPLTGTSQYAKSSWWVRAQMLPPAVLAWTDPKWRVGCRAEKFYITKKWDFSILCN